MVGLIVACSTANETATSFCTVLPDGLTVLQRQIHLMRRLGVTDIRIVSNVPEVCEREVMGECSVEEVSAPFFLLENREFMERLLEQKDDVLVVDANILVSAQLIKKLAACTRSAVVADFSAEYSRSKIAGHSIMAHGENSVLLRPVDSGVEAAFEVDGICYPLYKFFYEDLKQRVRYLRRHPNASGKGDVRSIDVGDGMNARILNCNDDLPVLLDTDNEIDIANVFLSFRMRDQEFVIDPEDLNSLGVDLLSAEYQRTVLICEDALKEHPVFAEWEQAEIFSKVIMVGEGQIDAKLAQDLNAQLNEHGCTCLVCVGGNDIQNLGKYLSAKSVMNGGAQIYHIAVPTAEAVHTVARAELSAEFELNGADSAGILLPNKIIYSRELDNTLASSLEMSVLALTEVLSALFSAQAGDMVSDYAEKTVTYMKKCMFAQRGCDGKNNSGAVRAQLWSARAANISGSTAMDGVAQGLRDKGIPAHQAALIAAGGLMGLLYRRMEESADARGRRVIANAFDEVGNLLEVSAGELVELLADLLYLTEWEPEKYDTVPCGKELAAFITDEQRGRIPIDISASDLDAMLQPWFKASYSVFTPASEREQELEERGYSCRCIENVNSYSAFLKKRFQYRSLHAKHILHKTFLELFDAVSGLCREHELRYILVGSTLLGAQLEDHLLPTADTFEIAMPWEDLEKLVTLGEKLGDGFSIKSPLNNPGCAFPETRVYRNGTQWIRLHNVYAVGERKEVYLTIWPLYSAKGSGKDEQRRVRKAERLSLILTHKRGEHHRKVGWKGEIVFRRAAKIPVSKLMKRLTQLYADREGSYYLCGAGKNHADSRLPKKVCFPARTVEFEGRTAAVPQTNEFLYKQKSFEARLKEKQNNFLLPGTYLLDVPEHGLNGITLAQPSQKVPKPMSRKAIIKQMLDWAKKKCKSLVTRKKKQFKTWYTKKAKPAVKTWLRTQYVKVFGTLRGMGLCFSHNSKVLKSYRNKYEGQRCFLIGNGPSLRAEDLDLLQDEITLGCNFIHKIYPQTKWRPTYHFLSDSSTVRTASWDLVKNLDKERTTMFIREFAYKFMYVKPDDAVLVPYVSTSDYKVRGNFLAYHYISHATVMSMMLEAAFYMGFKEIYLIGVDGTTASSQGGNFVKNYFSPEQRAQLDKLKKKSIQNYDVFARRRAIQERQAMVYRKLREYADEHGIKVYNATRGGVLEAFERADFDEVIGNK